MKWAFVSLLLSLIVISLAISTIFVENTLWILVAIWIIVLIQLIIVVNNIIWTEMIRKRYEL